MKTKFGCKAGRLVRFDENLDSFKKAVLDSLDPRDF